MLRSATYARLDSSLCSEMMIDCVGAIVGGFFVNFSLDFYASDPTSYSNPFLICLTFDSSTTASSSLLSSDSSKLSYRSSSSDGY